MRGSPIARWRLLAVALLASGCSNRPASPDLSGPPLLEVSTCRACHQSIVDSYTQTAHFNTSAPADSHTIKGHFTEGRNTLQTRNLSLRFTMDHRQQGFYQTAADQSRLTSRSERFDLVMGSARKGQSYLYWKNGRLFQLPVSYLTGLDQWINSPGYLDGQVDFDRPIGPRCLECHSTTFQVAGDPSGLSYAGEYRLGITCEKCHGDGRRHIAFHTANPKATAGAEIRNPARFPRDRQLDNCALCHSGVREWTKPAFSYRPGEPLDDFFRPETDSTAGVPDVHGNQIALLRQTKCFRASPAMSCATCHDVHRPQRDLTQMAEKCLGCHQIDKHPRVTEIGDRLMSGCIGCHMPDQKSNAIQINTPTAQFSPYYRSHLIAVYPGNRPR